MAFDAEDELTADRAAGSALRLRNWKQIVEKVDFAFQPIVNPHTGHIFGYEALLRRWEDSGFDSIQSLRYGLGNRQSARR